MGCASSKRSRCRHCHCPYDEPVARSYTMHVHHPPQRKGDSYHVVALTSTTLGTLTLESSENQNNYMNGNAIEHDDKKHGVEKIHNSNERSKEFSMGVIEAKTWSNMINEKIPKVVPKTPIATPPGEPETINTWELMEGLEDKSPLRPINHVQSFSFDLFPNPIHVPFDRPSSKLQENGIESPKPMHLQMADTDSNSELRENGRGSPNPMWLQMADDDSNSKSIISDFDPDVISSFRKSMEELPPDKPFHLRPLDNENPPEGTDSKKENGVLMDYKRPSFSKEKVVVYFTSLRGVRKTYEDCCHVRVILKGLGVRIDDRDVSMHSGFKDELKELLGDGFHGGGLSLPRVFIGKRYIGGAEEIRRMHEDGQLEKLVEGCEMMDDCGGSGGGGGGVCEACGDIRFVPCETCSGSCKIYFEADADDDDADEEEEAAAAAEEGCEYGFQRCPDCNENGLIRCPICCY